MTDQEVDREANEDNHEDNREVAYPTSDTGNPFSNATGEYLQSKMEGLTAVTVTSVSPDSGHQSAATAVTITGTGFLPSPTVSVSGTGVSVSSVVRVSSTSITATFTATGGATLGERCDTVTNTGTSTPYSTDTKAEAFEVTAP